MANTYNLIDDMDSPSIRKVEFATAGGSKIQIWRARLRLLRRACFENNAQIRRQVFRQFLYKAFKPLFKAYYISLAKRNALSVKWNGIYCGGKKGLVTVVLPVYNQADLLEKSIDSVLAQTYQDFELIIVNDGSTDWVERILDKYAGHPKIAIFEQQNQKLSAALNTGFAHAKGEFFTWTSADNIMLPNQLREQVRFLRQNDFVQMVYCNYELIDEEGKPLKHLANSEKIVVNTDQDVQSLSYTYNFINACFLYRNCVARIIGNYDPNMYGAEDYDYWMRINNHFAIQHIDHKESYYRYRIHGNTILRREGESTIDETVKKAQQLDVQRQSFFRVPMTFYAPRDMFPKKQTDEDLCQRRKPQVVHYQTCQNLYTFLSSGGNNKQKVLFLTNMQMKERKYLSLLERRKGDKSLFTFGIVTDQIRTDRREVLELLDWLIVDTQELYDSLREAHNDKLLCIRACYNYIDLCTIIANCHLFYKSIGRKAFCPVPEHHIYGHETSGTQ